VADNAGASCKRAAAAVGRSVFCTEPLVYKHTAMPIFQGAALASSKVAADTSAQESANVAAALAQAAVDQLQSQKPKRVRKRIVSDMVQLCPGIGFNELCWMCPTDSDSSYAHLCLVIQVGQGMCLLMKCL